MPPERVIIDTDPAIGVPFRDVDDALAVLYLLALPDEFEVLGLTPVFGNAPLRRCLPKAREVLAVAGRGDIGVHPGAASSRALGIETPASAFLARAVREDPGNVTVLALGPLTNIATAGILDPGFYANVSRLVIMGGALSAEFGPLPFPFEFNFRKDIKAAEAVLAADCAKVLITMDLCMQVVFSRRELDALESMNNRAGTYLARHVAHWYGLNHLAPVPWKGGFVPWDVIAAVYLRRGGLFEGPECGVRLLERPMRTGGIERRGDRARPCGLPERVIAAELLDDFLSAIDSFEKGRPVISPRSDAVDRK